MAAGANRRTFFLYAEPKAHTGSQTCLALAVSHPVSAAAYPSQRAAWPPLQENCRLCYIPENLIVRKDVEKVLEHPEPVSEDDRRIRARYGLTTWISCCANRTRHSSRSRPDRHVQSGLHQPGSELFLAPPIRGPVEWHPLLKFLIGRGRRRSCLQAAHLKLSKTNPRLTTPNSSA